jgi:hypothetical protein
MFKERIFYFLMKDMSSIKDTKFELAIKSRFYFIAKHKVNSYIDDKKKDGRDLYITKFEIHPC